MNGSERLFTFKSGGWVVLAAVLVSMALTSWAIMPVLLKQRPPGDGQNIESYGFDLSTLLIPASEIATPMLHRDMLPRLDDPRTITAAQAWAINEEQRGKYLVTSDRVVGVVINGEARAYPISLLTVHEIINDTLGGRPITVTYSWPGDAVRVFDREVGDEVLEFGVSGLLYNANMLMYDRRESDSSLDWLERGESLWSQLQGRAVSGPAAEAQRTLTAVPAQLVSWSHWQELQPETTVIDRDPSLIKRYRRAEPGQYFISSERPPFPVKPLAEQANGKPGWKDRVVAISTGGEHRVYPVSMIARRAAERYHDSPSRDARLGESQYQEPRYQESPNPDARPTWADNLGGVELVFISDPSSNTVAVFAPNGEAFEMAHAFWFAWHAMRPDDELAQ